MLLYNTNDTGVESVACLIPDSIQDAGYILQNPMWLKSWLFVIGVQWEGNGEAFSVIGPSYKKFYHQEQELYYHSWYLESIFFKGCKQLKVPKMNKGLILGIIILNLLHDLTTYGYGFFCVTTIYWCYCIFAFDLFRGKII